MTSDDAGRPAGNGASPEPSPPVPGQPLPAQPVVAGTVQKQRSVPLVLAIVLGFVVLVAGVVGFVIYDRATAIDRSTPVVSGDGFLQASLVDRTTTQVNLYTCRRWPAQEALAAMQALIDPEARVSWDTFTVLSQTADTALLSARVRFQYPGEVAPSGEALWQLTLVSEDGWRVCSVAESIAVVE